MAAFGILKQWADPRQQTVLPCGQVAGGQILLKYTTLEYDWSKPQLSADPRWSHWQLR